MARLDGLHPCGLPGRQDHALQPVDQHRENQRHPHPDAQRERHQPRLPHLQPDPLPRRLRVRPSPRDLRHHSPHEIHQRPQELRDLELLQLDHTGRQLDEHLRRPELRPLRLARAHAHEHEVGLAPVHREAEHQEDLRHRAQQFGQLLRRIDRQEEREVVSIREQRKQHVHEIVRSAPEPDEDVPPLLVPARHQFDQGHVVNQNEHDWALDGTLPYASWYFHSGPHGPRARADPVARRHVRPVRRRVDDDLPFVLDFQPADQPLDESAVYAVEGLLEINEEHHERQDRILQLSKP